MLVTKTHKQLLLINHFSNEWLKDIKVSAKFECAIEKIAKHRETPQSAITKGSKRETHCADAVYRAQMETYSF